MNYLLTKIAMEEWAAMDCNGRTFEKLPPSPGIKLSCNNGLQWTAMGGLLRSYPLPPE